MLGRGKAIAKKQAELEKQLSGLKNAVALYSQESKSAVEGISKEFKHEIHSLHESFRALDGNVKVQMSAVNEVTSAIGKSTNLEAINLLEMMQTFSDRLNHLEDVVNHPVPTTVIEQAEVFNAPVGIPSGPVEGTGATDATPKAAPRRSKGGRRRRRTGEYSGSPASDPAVEA